MKPRHVRTRGRRRRITAPDASVNEVTELADEIERHTESSPRLTGGDVDAGWDRAAADGRGSRRQHERDRHRWRIEREIALEERKVEEP
jgi:hypothetical protein